jgi:hypothetical protein
MRKALFIGKELTATSTGTPIPPALPLDRTTSWRSPKETAHHLRRSLLFLSGLFFHLGFLLDLFFLG